MKKNNFLLMLVMTSFLGFAQIKQTNYRGAFAPAPTAMWTDSWTNFDPQNTVYPTANVTVNSAITTNTTWTTGNTYLLSGQIYVKNNATLTIQPGVKVLGDLNGSALIVTKGAKLNAIGTAANPIVFTSDKPVGQRTKGDWGGIILLGKGSFNINGGVNNIEGIAATADTQYGGGATPDDNDNSGTLKYVRIEFGGYVYASNSEINGLTMGAVGRGTVIDYVQVSQCNDDAFEWFGGSVDCKHLVSFKNLDDDFDTDNGYNGRVQFALAVRDPQVADAPAVSTSEGFESDNNATGSTVTPATSAIFSNITMVGPSYRVTLPNGGSLASGYKRVARIRRASQLKIYNSVFMDYQEGLHVDGVAAENNAVSETLRFNNNILAGIVTTTKVIQVSSPGTITAGNNASFNMTTWFENNGNSSFSTNEGLLTSPYNTSDATVYTGLDYRPATQSPALTGASFTDAPFTGILEPLATTKIKTSQCGITIAALSTYIGADVVSGAQGYKFQITNGETVRYFEGTSNVLVLSNVSGTLFNTTYAIKVAVKIDGSFGPYGTSCNITTPAATTKIKSSQCGITIAALSTYIGADVVSGAEGYKFEITNGETVRHFEGTSHLLVLSNVSGTLFSTTYAIKVAVKMNGSFGPYGTSCNITTPAATTKIKSSQCGTTIAALSTYIGADVVSGAQGYKFQITNGETVRYFEGTSHLLVLGNVSGTLYNTTYSIKVAVKLNDVFGDYGVACNITTPANAPLTKLKNSQCGVTIAALNTSLAADVVSGVNGYKFEVTNGETVRYYEAASYIFNLTQLTGSKYNTTYSVRVATTINGGTSYGEYGTACNVTTPAAAPLTKIKTSQCPANLAGLATTIYANIIAGVDGYKFEVTNGETVRYYTSSTYYFKLSQLSGGASYGTTYSVRVATTVNGGVSYGTYGDSCDVTTPAPAIQSDEDTTEVTTSEESKATVSVKSYPNPFTSTFKLDLTSITKENVEVTVYDMTGNIVEKLTVKSSEINNVELGTKYRTGIYNVVLTQGSFTKTFRVAKN